MEVDLRGGNVSAGPDAAVGCEAPPTMSHDGGQHRPVHTAHRSSGGSVHPPIGSMTEISQHPIGCQLQTIIEPRKPP